MLRIQRLLLLVGIVCLGTYIVFTVQAHFRQEQMEETFDQMVQQPAEPEAPKPAEERRLEEGDLVGRLQIPRLNVSVMVLEGVGSQTLRLAAGHIPGTALPGREGNMGIAAHRDTFFRPLSKIEPNDRIEFSTPGHTTEYRVVSTKIVMPEDTEVLRPTGSDTLTLVTCYPFYYIGPAPKRFIVTAQKE